MTDTCQNHGCEREPLGRDAPAHVRAGFCSPECELSHEHIRDDAREAMLADKRRAERNHEAVRGP